MLLWQQKKVLQRQEHERKQLVKLAFIAFLLHIAGIFLVAFIHKTQGPLILTIGAKNKGSGGSFVAEFATLEEAGSFGESLSHGPVATSDQISAAVSEPLIKKEAVIPVPVIPKKEEVIVKKIAIKDTSKPVPVIAKTPLPQMTRLPQVSKLVSKPVAKESIPKLAPIASPLPKKPDTIKTSLKKEVVPEVKTIKVVSEVKTLPPVVPVEEKPIKQLAAASQEVIPEAKSPITPTLNENKPAKEAAQVLKSGFLAGTVGESKKFDKSDQPFYIGTLGKSGAGSEEVTSNSSGAHEIANIIEEQWYQVKGMPPQFYCDLEFEIGSDGKVINLKIIDSYKSLIYQAHVKDSLSRCIFSKKYYGKKCRVILKS